MYEIGLKFINVFLLIQCGILWLIDLQNVLRWLTRGSEGDPVGYDPWPSINQALGANNLQTVGDGPHPLDMC